ncbi:MAG TPA: sigma-70 family RNA polymerase sigma factor [Xanthobacteraceae bacterium]
MEAARAGDSQALTELYLRFAPILHGILLSYVSASDAQDLTHEVFETVMTRLPELRNSEAFPGWIVSIARRRALNVVRRPVVEVPVDVQCADHRQSPENLAAAEQALTAICSLPPAYRETLILRLVEGLTGPEIAERTGMTEGSVRVNLYRGMSQLRTALHVDINEVSDSE